MFCPCSVVMNHIIISVKASNLRPRNVRSLMLLFIFQGNRLFKDGKFELAKAKYEKVNIVFTFISSISGGTILFHDFGINQKENLH
jgi:hypothetical protein